jgi:hypothetical protein
MGGTGVSDSRDYIILCTVTVTHSHNRQSRQQMNCSFVPTLWLRASRSDRRPVCRGLVGGGWFAQGLTRTNSHDIPRVSPYRLAAPHLRLCHLRPRLDDAHAAPVCYHARGRQLAQLPL